MLALVTDAFGGYGGIAQYNRDFLTAFAALPGVEAVEVFPRLAGPTGVLPLQIRQHRPVHARPVYALRAVWLAMRTRPRIVFCGHLYMAPLALLIARLSRSKLVIQTHGIEIWDKPTPPQRAALEAADLVLSVSRDTRRNVLGWSAGPTERIVVLPNTVGDHFAPGDGAVARRRMGLVNKRLLLSVSRLDAGQRYKGQDRVIPLIGPLVSMGHDVVYLIGGVGDDRERLGALAERHGVADRVHFLGAISDEELVQLYRSVDIYVMPSTGEGFGIVFLEAMASGVPAVGLAIGGARDALGDGELGAAAQESELLGLINSLLSIAPPDGKALAERVRARFGKRVFEERVAELAEAFL
jgi:phosphatidylinositol alpha-1,6-mannosyltransferase